MKATIISKMKLIDTVIANNVSIVLDPLSVLTQIKVSIADTMAELIPLYKQMVINVDILLRPFAFNKIVIDQ